ncbi:hypothetical protein [Saccharothrix sp. HUAS TT1]|uniref:hypothetical protein n=1 Tax=unclassified Saccharothrix TaxID=2593673 RepID=UPI00345BF783
MTDPEGLNDCRTDGNRVCGAHIPHVNVWVLLCFPEDGSRGFIVGRADECA